MDTQDKLGAFSTAGSICDPITVTVSDTTKGGDYTSSRTVAVRLGACSVEDFLTIISAASNAARAREGVS